MRLEEFFDKFELFAEAPNAVAKMRELIFELAATGKLIPEFLGPPVASDMSLMGEVVELIMGQAPPGNECNTDGDGTVFVKVGEFGDLYPERTVWTTKPLKMAKTGDVLICVVGATVGKLNLAIDCSIGRSVAAIRPSEKLNTKFLYYSLMPYTLRLRRNSRGSAQGVIGKAELNKILLWVPSIEMQQKVVAKVDELMTLCDRLEAQQQERATRHAALARASLARFAADPTPANLEYLFHKSYVITPADLRKTILTLAVQGKLVVQDKSDSSVVELIEHVAARRNAENLKKYEAVDQDDVPFEIPDSWSWVRLGNISLESDSGWSPQCHPEPRSGKEWGVLKVSAVSWGAFRPEENKALPLGIPGRPECEVKTGDFLLSRANTEELVARSVIVEKTPPRLMMSDKIVRFTFPAEIDKAYINLANSSSFARDYYARNASGTSSSMKNVGREVMCNLPVPLPPLVEQRRIVSRVEQLMALVDQLEGQLTASRATAEKLMEAVVSELTAVAA
jgi:Restriction endonuclease S subunits